MPPAARIGDDHKCPQPGPPPHVGLPILGPGAMTVITGGSIQACVGDIAPCTGPPDAIAKGSVTVLAGGRPAARMLDPTVHGGLVTRGEPTVLIGDSVGQCLCAASASGAAGVKGGP